MYIDNSSNEKYLNDQKIQIEKPRLWLAKICINDIMKE